MDGIKVDIDPVQIEKAVTEAIIASSIGEAIEKQIKEALKPSIYGGTSLLEEAIKSEIKKSICQIVNQLLKEKEDVIRAAVKEQLTDIIISEAVKNTIDYCFLNDNRSS